MIQMEDGILLNTLVFLIASDCGCTSSLQVTASAKQGGPACSAAAGHRRYIRYSLVHQHLSKWVFFLFICAPFSVRTASMNIFLFNALNCNNCQGYCGAVGLLAAVIMCLCDGRVQLVLCWREGKNYFTDEQPENYYCICTVHVIRSLNCQYQHKHNFNVID